MTTGQIVILSILSLGIFISWVINLYAEKENNRLFSSFCQIVLTTFIAMMAFSMTHEREKALKNLQGKCPELEKLENVYKIK